jgi:hypothetical protein
MYSKYSGLGQKWILFLTHVFTRQRSRFTMQALEKITTQLTAQWTLKTKLHSTSVKRSSPLRQCCEKYSDNRMIQRVQFLILKSHQVQFHYCILYILSCWNFLVSINCTYENEVLSIIWSKVEYFVCICNIQQLKMKENKNIIKKKLPSIYVIWFHCLTTLPQMAIF